MSRPVIQLILWSLREYFREPAVLFWTLGFPILMTLGLGQINLKPKPFAASVAVLAGPGEEAKARAWAEAAPLRPQVDYFVTDEAGAVAALAMGRAKLYLSDAWDGARRRYHFDPANQDADLAHLRLRQALDGRASQAEPVLAKGGRYVDFLLPGLLALGLVSSCLWGVGYNLIEMRSRKFLRLMMASPLRPLTFFASLFLARLGLAVGEALILLSAADLLFDVSISGSLAAFAALQACGVAGFFGLAVLAASRTDKASVGQGLINLVTLPMFVVSGVFFGLDGFPKVLQAAFRAFPPTLLVDATRAVVNAGAGLEQVAAPCLALLAMGALCLGLGARIFRYY